MLAREWSFARGVAETPRAHGEVLAQRGEIDVARKHFAESLSALRWMDAQRYIERTERALMELE